MQDQSNNFLDMVATVYSETSRHLLDILHNKYKFMDHLKVSKLGSVLNQGLPDSLLKGDVYWFFPGKVLLCIRAIHLAH